MRYVLHHEKQALFVLNNQQAKQLVSVSELHPNLNSLFNRCQYGLLKAHQSTSPLKFNLRAVTVK